MRKLHHWAAPAVFGAVVAVLAFAPPAFVISTLKTGASPCWVAVNDSAPPPISAAFSASSASSTRT